MPLVLAQAYCWGQIFKRLVGFLSFWLKKSKTSKQDFFTLIPISGDSQL